MNIYECVVLRWSSVFRDIGHLHADTRIQLGCAAAEKSLERKLGEAQKKYFPMTNGKDGAQVWIGQYMWLSHLLWNVNNDHY